MKLKESDEIKFRMVADKNRKKVTLTIISTAPMTMDEYLLALVDFVQSANPDAADLFLSEKPFASMSH